jgi:hypothetical protein
MSQWRPIILLTGMDMLGTIPDYVAVGLLLMMLLAAAGLLARGKFEL